MATYNADNLWRYAQSRTPHLDGLLLNLLGTKEEQNQILLEVLSRLHPSNLAIVPDK
jgi:hypothetical protein